MAIDIVDTKHAFLSFGLPSGIDTFDHWAFGTADGGSTWTARAFTVPAQATNMPDVLGIYFLTPTLGVFEFQLVVQSTKTGWGSWKSPTVLPAMWNEPPVTFLGTSNWAMPGPYDSSSSTIGYATSFNQGTSWTVHTATLPTIPDQNDASLTFLGQFNWVLQLSTTTVTTTYATHDGATTWTKVGNQPFLGKARFIDMNHAWLWSPDGPLEVTSNGGVNWQLVTPGIW